MAIAVPTAAVAAPWTLERSEVLSVAAPDGTAYEVMVAWPEGDPPPSGWPALYLLDGERHFASFSVAARGRPGTDPGVIVAIASGGRARRAMDYTPAAPGYVIPKGTPAHGLQTGGADRFLSFLHRDVRGAIAARWPIDAGRETLAGHSFGALLALESATGDAPFARYALISASTWFGGDYLARRIGAWRPSAAPRLLIGAAPDEGVRRGDGAFSPTALAGLLAARGADVEELPLPGQTHGTTMFAATPAIIKLAFGREAQP